MKVQAARRALMAIDAAQRFFGGEVKSCPALPERPSRILVWSMDRIGDVQRGTPVFRLLKHRYPGTAITAVVAGRAAPVLSNNPHIAALEVVHKPYDFMEHLRVVRSLRRERWDLGLLLEVDRPWAKIGEWSFRWLGVEVWTALKLGNSMPRRAIPTAIRADGSWTDQFIALAVAAGARDDGLGMQLCLSDHERSWARDFLQVHGIAPSQRFFLVHPGGGSQIVLRHWPPDRYGTLIDGMRRNWRWPVVVTGSAPEQPIADAIRAHCRSGFVDLCGKLDLRQLAAVIERSAICVMNDTGPLHMAHALRRPAVAILGPTAPQSVGIPESTIAVHADLPCRPCAFLMDWTACRNRHQFACLDRLEVDTVLSAVVDHVHRLGPESSLQ